MKLSIRIIVSILIFLGSVFLAFIIEDEYRKSVRWLYEILSNHNISFHHPAKNIHFASGYFVSSIGAFFVIIFNFIFNQKKHQILLNMVISLVLFTTSIVVYSAMDSKLKLIECTACENGLRTLEYNNILYDRIMILALISTLLPWVFTEFINRKKNGSLK